MNKELCLLKISEILETNKLPPSCTDVTIPSNFSSKDAYILRKRMRKQTLKGLNEITCVRLINATSHPGYRILDTLIDIFCNIRVFDCYGSDISTDVFYSFIETALFLRVPLMEVHALYATKVSFDRDRLLRLLASMPNMIQVFRIPHARRLTTLRDDFDESWNSDLIPILEALALGTHGFPLQQFDVAKTAWSKITIYKRPQIVHLLQKTSIHTIGSCPKWLEPVLNKNAAKMRFVDFSSDSSMTAHFAKPSAAHLKTVMLTFLLCLSSSYLHLPMEIVFYLFSFFRESF